MALIVAAPAARFPTLFVVLGWISIVAALALLLFGRARRRALLGWFERMPDPLPRVCVPGSGWPEAPAGVRGSWGVLARFLGV